MKTNKVFGNTLCPPSGFALLRGLTHKSRRHKQRLQTCLVRAFGFQLSHYRDKRPGANSTPFLSVDISVTN